MAVKKKRTVTVPDSAPVKTGAADTAKTTDKTGAADTAKSTDKTGAADTAKSTGKADAPETAKSTGKADAPETADTNGTVRKGAAGFPIVGIGASAGGLAAFEAFFSGMPADKDPGMAFVLVQHLAPDHKSILTDLVRRYTRMDVFEVKDGMTVKPNCTYIIPPNRDMAFLNGTLHLMEPAAPRGQRLPIDFFFQSLAQDQHEKAICIVLSGTGSDGSLGLRAIKGEGGMVMAQSPASTEYDGMPRSAIGTGLVDFELPPVEMAAQLIIYATHAFGKSEIKASEGLMKSENAFRKIFILLRAQTGHDFSEYKISTIHRRIERRMAIHQIDAVTGYVNFLQKNPAEVELLFRDLLIGVTSFFRDADAFKALEEQAIPGIFSDKSARSVIRVWSTGCSSGEEAYSIAILLQEKMDELRQSFKVQVFATDIDSRAIAFARSGRYPVSIAADITPARLARFFTLEPDGMTYRIHKSIRDLLVFSEQDVIKDSPFSKLDLISCRNLMIYLGSELQKKLIPLFHYALNPGGVLFLGTSESIGENDQLFSGINKKMKLFGRRESNSGIPSPLATRFARQVGKVAAIPHRTGEATTHTAVPSLRERAEKSLLKQMSPASALVTGKGDILYLHGRTGMYLEPTPGEVNTLNILKMAREGLAQSLTVTLHKAVDTHEAISIPNVRVKTNGHHTLIHLTVCPVEADPNDLGTPLYLVVMQETSSPDPNQAVPESFHSDTGKEAAPPDSDDRFTLLHEELRAKEEYLHTANEELETSNEELKSSNEEMQSVNEELQSTNEELETAKEELQSVNEELSTVNSELQNKVSDLTRINNDMNNLLAGTGIGTVFVDFHLHIRRFTPAAAQIINLIPSDVARPLAHVVTNLVDYDKIVPDTKAVLDTLIPRAVEVKTLAGQWYMMRIQPYRTIENIIEGAVISFIDISEIVVSREALRKANDLLRLAVVVRDSNDAITVQDPDGRILAWNPSAVRVFGWSEEEALLMNVRDRIPKDRVKEEMSIIQKLARSKVLEPYPTQRIAKGGKEVEVWMTSTALINEMGLMYAIATTERVRD